jgi:predicted outer membrane repeat protein
MFGGAIYFGPSTTKYFIISGFNAFVKNKGTYGGAIYSKANNEWISGNTLWKENADDS